MTDDALDLAVAQYVKKLGLVSPEQLVAAAKEQAKLAEGGAAITLAAALVRVGALTPVQRESV